MNSDKFNFWSFLATLGTIIVLAICGTVAVRSGSNPTVYLATITGLIGVLGTFKPRTGGGNVNNADTVNQGT